MQLASLLLFLSSSPKKEIYVYKQHTSSPCFTSSWSFWKRKDRWHPGCLHPSIIINGIPATNWALIFF
jgi:hypothetical protein